MPAGRPTPQSREQMIDFSSPRHQAKFGYLLLLPALAFVAALIVYPIVLSVDLSLQDVKIPRIGAPSQPWTLKNYQWLVASGEFWSSLWVSIRLVLVVCGVSLTIGLATALLLNLKFRGRAIARLLIVLPWAVPEVMAVVIWAWMLDSSFGVVNYVLVNLHILAAPIHIPENPVSAFAAVSAVFIWKSYPFMCIMLLAGLQSIPEEYYQAARVDGANAVKRLIYITIPCLLPVMAVVVIMTTLWVFKDFTVIFVLTQGGPLGATDALPFLTWAEAFSFFRMGHGAALGVVTMVICVVISALLASRFIRRVNL
jgi:multiple sugar transport system permease protein